MLRGCNLYHLQKTWKLRKKEYRKKGRRNIEKEIKKERKGDGKKRGEVVCGRERQRERESYRIKRIQVIDLESI